MNEFDPAPSTCRPRRRRGELAVIERHSSWYLSGTVRTGLHSTQRRRIRETTWLPARPDTRAVAEELCRSREREIRRELSQLAPSPPMLPAFNPDFETLALDGVAAMARIAESLDQVTRTLGALEIRIDAIEQNLRSLNRRVDQLSAWPT
jgi:hypothetical protein